MLLGSLPACGGREDTPPNDGGTPIDARAGSRDGAPGDAADGPIVDAGSDPTLDAGSESCAGIGRRCVAACPGELECVRSTGGDFCAPARPECGGFAGAECTGAGQTCAYLADDSAGVCLTAAERACVCAESPSSLESCAAAGAAASSPR